MCVDINQGGAPNYFPNSFSGPTEDATFGIHRVRLTGDVARYDTGDDDNFSQVCGRSRVVPLIWCADGALSLCGGGQAGVFYRKVLGEAEKERLTTNIAQNLAGAQEFIQKRAIANFTAADPDYGARIARKVAAASQKGTCWMMRVGNVRLLLIAMCATIRCEFQYHEEVRSPSQSSTRSSEEHGASVAIVDDSQVGKGGTWDRPVLE
jgi:hypothetical protein